MDFFSVIFLVVITNFKLIIPTLVFIILLYFLYIFVFPTLEKLRKIESSTSSNICTHLRSTLDGLTTIRALKGEKKVLEGFSDYQDISNSTWFTRFVYHRGFRFLADAICVCFTGVILFSFVIFDDLASSASDRGLAIMQVSGLVTLVAWGMTMITLIEDQIISSERIFAYSKLPKETGKFNLIDQNFSEGKIEFKDVCVKYSRNDKIVLRNLNFMIKPREKIGIVGRTGSGKSTMALSLFRFVELFKGSITIDDKNIAQLSLKCLRKHLTMIPQDAILFTGSLRTNLDPDNEHSDRELWKVLKDVYLEDIINSMAGKLHCKVSENGSNFSIGQRQLISLARALLRKTKILIFDEVTSNIDSKTDELIQSTIKSNFSDCTILTIAHRLETIVDSDRVLVMENGCAVEFGHPHKLIESNESFFKSLVQQSGQAEKLSERARKSYKKFQ